jgi:dUTP pyrophosphatase
MIEFRLQDGGKLPSKGSQGAAGYDIRSTITERVLPFDRVLVPTGVYLNRLPPNSYLRIAPRSKLANKFGIDVLAGVVDADYRGEIMVILHNTSENSFLFNEGDAIAQLILEQIVPSEVTDVTHEWVYDPTERGEDGISSVELRA